MSPLDLLGRNVLVVDPLQRTRTELAMCLEALVNPWYIWARVDA